MAGHYQEMITKYCHFDELKIDSQSMSTSKDTCFVKEYLLQSQCGLSILLTSNFMKFFLTNTQKFYYFNRVARKMHY